MNQTKWREYNRLKQREYRTKKRGKAPRKWIAQEKIEDILKSVGHCSYCGMLLKSEYHKLHPLVGCLKAQR